MAKNINRSWTVYGSKKTVNTPGGTSVVNTTQFLSTATVISGGLNPNYKQAIARGVQAGTTLSVDAQDVSFSPGSAYAKVKTSPTATSEWTAKGLFPSVNPSYAAPLFDSAAEAEAVRKLYRKIREVHTEFQGGVFLGEIGQTVRLFTRPLDSFTKATTRYMGTTKRAVDSVKRGAGSAHVKEVSIRKIISNEYLKWTFGVVPLMNDIKDISRVLSRLISDPPRVGFSAKGKAESGTVSVLANLSIMGNVRALRTETRKTLSKVKYYGAFKVMTKEEETRSKLARIQQLSGLTLRDFIPTVWNLIPYSFIADYFVNIGDVLEALTTDTSRVTWLSRTQSAQSVYTHSIIPDVGASKASGQPTWIWTAFSGSPGGFVAKRTVINRANAVVPMMEFRFKFGHRPGKKVLNLLALIAARM